MHPAMAGPHARVLILGGGDGLAAREVLRHPGVRRVDLVELDPAVVDLARRDPGLTTLNDRAYGDRRLHPVTADAFDWLRSARTGTGARPGGGYDVVIADLPHPGITSSTKLYSEEFFGLAARVLAPGGRIAVHSGSPVDRPKTFWTVDATLRAAGLVTTPYSASGTGGAFAFGPDRAPRDHPKAPDWGFLLAGRERPPLTLAPPVTAGPRSLSTRPPCAPAAWPPRPPGCRTCRPPPSATRATRTEPPEPGGDRAPEPFRRRRRGYRTASAWVGSAGMEHEVFVPVPAEALRAALRAPATAVRGVPGLQLDPAAEGGAGGAASALTGRLRLRLDGRTITYRGTLRLTTEADGAYVFEVEGGEARGTGHGRATVRLRLTPAEGGTRVVLEVRSRVEGRGARLDPVAAERGVRALLTQAVEALAGDAGGQAGASGQGPSDAGEGTGEDAGALLDTPGGGTPAAGPDVAGKDERPGGQDRPEDGARAEEPEDETAEDGPKPHTPAASPTTTRSPPRNWRPPSTAGTAPRTRTSSTRTRSTSTRRSRRSSRSPTSSPPRPPTPGAR
ncbi:SRPBCC family protein [Actinomadura keratinilytica]